MSLSLKERGCVVSKVSRRLDRRHDIDKVVESRAEIVLGEIKAMVEIGGKCAEGITSRDFRMVGALLVKTRNEDDASLSANVFPVTIFSQGQLQVITREQAHSLRSDANLREFTLVDTYRKMSGFLQNPAREGTFLLPFFPFGDFPCGQGWFSLARALKENRDGFWTGPDPNTRAIFVEGLANFFKTISEEMVTTVGV